MMNNNSASYDDDAYSQHGQRGFCIQALRPFQQVDNGTPWTCAQVRLDSRIARIHEINALDGLNEEHEYDPEVLSALSSWANKVHIKAPKNAKVSRTPETDQATDWNESRKKTQ